ncbi:hypothetical protein IWW39_001067 [Coemansia spiralis]|uniref:molybdopterin adenylyltransferase n=1 Tax=Coemansia spiralis TaxID=417178 RepID=A0A9W8GIL7_9FUNG|nr:hypothetical protein IWW39_001067 [Coemansia spiralis]
MATPVGILTVSDKCSQGQALDTSGPALRQLLEATVNGRQQWAVVTSLVVPDDRTLISQTIGNWSATTTSGPLCRLVIVTGGTGISPSDVTVEAIEPLFAKRLPSLATAMVVGSLKITPMAALSQVAAGVVGETIVVAVPGSKKGSVENLQQILGVLPHAVDTAMAHSGTRHLHTGSGTPIVSTAEPQPLAMCGCNRPDEDGVATHVAEGLSNDLDGSVARRARKSPYPMIPVNEALKLVLSHVAELPAVELPLQDIREGQIIAADVVAREDVPGYPAAVMDGYAVIAADGPGTFTVRGATTAGRTAADSSDGPLRPGEVVRVATGAPIPPGADAVVMVEDTQLLESRGNEEAVVKILESGRVVPGQHIRAVGHDMRKGSVVVSAGSPITAVGGEIGALAISGHAKFLVHAMPRIAVLSTGDEVVDTLNPASQSRLEYGAIRDCNRPALLAALASLGCPTLDLGVVKDDPDSLAGTMARALSTCQGIISTGGVSMGEKDWLKPVVEQRLSGKIIFGRVAMKPSKPTTFATMSEGKFVFALPGNPVSALVAFHMFAAPAIRKLAGHLTRGGEEISVLRPSITAVFEGQDLILDRVRPEYLRAAVVWDQRKSKWLVRVTDQHQQSSRVASMLHANALISLPRGSDQKPRVRSGESVTAIMIAAPHIH